MQVSHAFCRRTIWTQLRLKFIRWVFVAEKKTGMTDQELTLQAVSKAQRIIEEYLQPIPHDHERLLDRLLQVLDGNDLVAAVDRLQRHSGTLTK